MVFGGYELDPVSRWEDGVPWDHAARSLPPDYERFEPLMAGAVRRFPFLADAEVIRLVCHPDAMTPDANPLLGPAARGTRLLGGRRAVAQRVRWRRRDRAGDGRLDHGRRSRRRHRSVPRVAVRGHVPRPDLRGRTRRARCTPTTTGCAIPYDADIAGRPRRLSAASRSPAGGRRRLRDEGGLGASRLPSSPAGRGVASGRDQAAYGWTQPPWFERVVAEGTGGPRARRAHRPQLVRQDRRARAGCARPTPAGLRQRRRSAGRQRRLHAVVRRTRRDGRRRDGHPSRGRTTSAS